MDMSYKMVIGGRTMNDLLGLIADINPTEIAAHIADGNLAEWCETWRQVATVAAENLRLAQK
jgi:hypothetical protein